MESWNLMSVAIFQLCSSSFFFIAKMASRKYSSKLFKSLIEAHRIWSWIIFLALFSSLQYVWRELRFRACEVPCDPYESKNTRESNRLIIKKRRSSANRNDAWERRQQRVHSSENLNHFYTFRSFHDITINIQIMIGNSFWNTYCVIKAIQGWLCHSVGCACLHKCHGNTPLTMSVFHFRFFPVSVSYKASASEPITPNTQWIAI